ncbi:hypothetical protein SPONN_504 [uncultured Candidatus Thioglobus sp.]|nr:hypothetical protein SPONN_504 [uncultured Candidatus Thioglobus sp.]
MREEEPKGTTIPVIWIIPKFFNKISQKIESMLKNRYFKSKDN